nr:gustatory receptor 26 [Papilio dardanus]
MPNRPDQYRVENILNTIKILLIFENIFCIFRYVPTKVVNVKRLKFFGVTVSIFSILFFVLNVEFPKNVGIDYYITTTVSPTLFLLQYVVTVIYFCFTRSNSLSQMMKMFTEIDKTVRILAIRDFYVKSRAATLKLTIIFVIFHILQIVAYIYYEKNIQTVEFVLVIAYIERNLEIILFCRFIYMIKMRLNIISNQLSSYLNKGHQSFNKKKILINVVSHMNISIDDQQIQIRKLADAYVKVGEIMCILNEDFNFQMLMTLASCFVVIVFSTWAIFFCFLSGKCSVAFFNVFIWTITEISIIGIVSFTCENVLSLRKTIIEYLDRLVMDYKLCAKTRTQAKAFRALINAWPLSIIVYNMFPIDFKLIIDFVGLATTSIIIVLQISHIL